MNRVTVENLNKDFKIYERPQDRLTEVLFRQPKHKLYHVLSDISFSLSNGQSLGVIGDNGAGKSTLLKLLVGTLQPTSGSITINGQVAALLELGAGFHPEFTGRKNIYLNASLLGVPDDNIPELENDIIAFSELESFIDRPVKTYSSGMFVRLAFSIATMVRPDILVIDEALSVGDMAFQKKCIERMNKFRQEQKTMVFCSHSMYHVQQLCDIAMWIDKGQIREIGNSEEVVGNYEAYCNHKKAYNSIEDDISEKSDESVLDETVDENQRDCRILSISIHDEQGNELESVDPLSDVLLKMEVEFLKDNVEGNFGFAFMRTTDDVIASWLTTEVSQVHKGPFKKGEKFQVSLRVTKIAMRTGQFYVLGGVADITSLLWYETKFSNPVRITANKGVGQMLMDCSWQVVKQQ